MSIDATLSLIILSVLGSSPVQAPQDGRTSFYGAAVTFEGGKCRFWTGDVGLSAREFQNDLQERFDPKLGIVIGYRAEVPARCVAQARRSATLAGFKIVKTVVDSDAGPVGPPVNGN